MRFEVPKFKRCCCCLPLRHGIIVLAFLNMGFAIFWLVLECMYGQQRTYTHTIYRGVIFFSHNWVPIVLYTTEVIFATVLIVGAFMKKHKPMLAYYYYGITTTAAALVIYPVICLHDMQPHIAFYIEDLTMLFSGVVTQVYLLLLIRSELFKDRNEEVSYVNHLCEVSVRQPRMGNGFNPL